MQNALNTVTEKQANIGTKLNRLVGIATASQMKIENLIAAKSTIMDTDIAKEIANMTQSPNSSTNFSFSSFTVEKHRLTNRFGLD